MRAVADDRRQAWSAALLAAAGYGVIAGWWMPRGPLSTLEGLSSMALGLLVGIVAGLLLRTRWAMLVAPVTFAVVFELVRSAISGPTVDGIHLTSAYGVIAFAVGRGVHGLLALVPLALGAGVGAAMARRPPPPTAARHGHHYEPALSYEQEVYPYSHAGNSEGAGQMGENIFVREYTLLEQLHLFGGFMDTSSVLYPQIQHLDFRTQATSLAVPVYLALGAHEAPGRAEPAKQWFHEQREHGRGDCAAEVADDGTLIIAAVALALPNTGYGFLLSAGAVVRLLAAAALAGALGAVLGAGRRHRHRCSSSDRRRRGRLRNRPERTGGRGRRLRCGCTTRRRVRRQGRRGDLATGGR